MPLRFRVLTTLAITIALATLLTWQHLHGGVPSHSFLARDDWPSISNWWGLLTLPVLTWWALTNLASRIERRRVTPGAALAGALGALLFGALLAGSYSLGYSEVPRVQVRVLPLLALALPIYRAESLLGFALALTYTFGGVLPVVIGAIFALIGALLYHAPRWLLGRFRMKR